MITIAMQRIKSLTHIEKSIDTVPSFNMEDYRNNRFGVFSGPLEKIHLQIDPRYALYFRNRSWHPSQQISTKKNGGLLLKMELPVSPELVTWILGWHTAIKVIKPDSLITLIKNKLAETLQKYQ